MIKFVNVGAYRTSKPIWHLFWFDQVIASTFSLIPVSISKFWALFIFQIVASPFNIVAAPTQFLALLTGIIFYPMVVLCCMVVIFTKKFHFFWVVAVVPSLGVYIYKFNVSIFRMISISATYRLIMPNEDYLYFVLRHDNALQSIALPHLVRGNCVCDKIQAIRVPITLSV